VLFPVSNRTTARFERRCAKLSGVDLFCGAGGLTRGLLDVGVNVVAGVDLDAACQHPYERNNHTRFLGKDVSDLSGDELACLYPDGHIRLLVGCAPCQPFSKYTQGFVAKNGAEWGLLRSFARIIRELKPDLVSMENVPELQRHSVFDDFVANLRALEYQVSF